ARRSGTGHPALPAAHAAITALGRPRAHLSWWFPATGDARRVVHLPVCDGHVCLPGGPLTPTGGGSLTPIGALCMTIRGTRRTFARPRVLGGAACRVRVGGCCFTPPKGPRRPPASASSR